MIDPPLADSIGALLPCFLQALADEAEHDRPLELEAKDDPAELDAAWARFIDRHRSAPWFDRRIECDECYFLAFVIARTYDQPPRPADLAPWLARVGSEAQAAVYRLYQPEMAERAAQAARRRSITP